MNPACANGSGWGSGMGGQPAWTERHMARLRVALVFLLAMGGTPALLSIGPLPTRPAWAQAASVTQPYLLAFLACNTAAANCMDPRNHQVYLAQSDDGANWSLPPGYTPVPGSVPDVVRRGQTLYMYFPGQLRRFEMDTGTWEAARGVSLTDTECPGFVDPSPIVDENGRIVLFYLCGGAPGSGDPAQCPPGVTTCVKRFRTATEVAGSDGVQFTADSGDRVQVTVRPSPGQFDSASDPDIFYDGTQYVLYVSRGNSTEVYTSRSLRGSYSLSTALPSGRISDNNGGIGSGQFDALRGQYWTFVHRPEPVQRIYRGVHPSLATQLQSADLVPIVTGSSLGLGATFSVASPGIAENANGPSLLMNTATGTISTPAQLTFQWRDLTRSPVYALEYCLATGSSGCFASQAGVTRFDSPAQTFWLVDGSDPTLRSVIGSPLGAGVILAYTRAGTTVTFTLPLPAPLDLRIQYRIFPVVISPSRVGTLNAPETIRGVVDLPPGGTSSLPVSVTLR